MSKVEKIVGEILELETKRSEIEDRLTILLSELNKSREFDDVWVWCVYCGHKHQHWSDRASRHHQHIKRIPKKCFLPNDHCWKSIEHKSGKKDEIGIPQISVEECIICHKKKEVIYAYR